MDEKLRFCISVTLERAGRQVGEEKLRLVILLL